MTEARLGATAAAIAGDSGTLYHLVSDLMDDGVSFETVLFELLAPTERDVGTRWQRGDTLISEEHAATATIETVVSLLAGSFDRPPTGETVVVATTEGDHHSLPARLVAAHLLYLGYRTTFLGANVLADDLAEYLEVEPPTALVLACAMSNHLVGARAAIRAGHSVGTPVLVGGRGFGERGEWAKLLGADSWAAELRQVPLILESWDPDPAQAETRATDPSAQLMDLIAHRSAIVASAQGELAASPAGIDVRTVEAIWLVLGALEAALLVGEDRPVADILAWQRDTTAGSQRTSLIGEALHTALADEWPEAAAVLNRGRTELERLV